MASHRSVRRAVIPSAGLGTRLLPATKAVPKELLPVVDKPSVQYIVEEAVASGIGQIIFVTSMGKEAILNHFDIDPCLERTLKERKKKDLLNSIKELSRMIEIISVRQKQPLGLGHAVLSAEEAVGDEPFAVLLPDDLVDGEKPCLAQMLEIFSKDTAGVVALERVQRSETKRYGIVRGEMVKKSVWRLEALIEKPSPDDAPSTLAVIGRYILPPEIFGILKKVKPGRDGEIQLTDGLNELAGRKNLLGLEFSGKRYDIGNPEGMITANIVYALKRREISESIRNTIRDVVKL